MAKKIIIKLKTMMPAKEIEMAAKQVQRFLEADHPEVLIVPSIMDIFKVEEDDIIIFDDGVGKNEDSESKA